ncbi:MAG: hypothetical protein JNM94_04115 [Phycisphaerae bacterium]|nr:hypothetical protein [Phycisphaerae bacterium]
MTRALVSFFVVIALAASIAFATQVPNENLANAILAARQKNAALMQQYNWNSRTEIDENGKMQDIRIELVSYLPNGELQRSLLNDQQGAMPGLFLRKAIEENQRKQVEEMVQGLGRLVEQYTLPTPGKMISYLVQAQVQPVTTAAGTTVLQIIGSGVVVPGDTFTMTFNGTTLQPTNIQINTTFNGNAVVVNGSFMTNRAGLNFLQYATAEVPSKNVAVMIHNFDYTLVN